MFPRAAELRAECCQEAAAHSDIVVATLTEELSTLREELENKTALGKRWAYIRLSSAHDFNQYSLKYE